MPSKNGTGRKLKMAKAARGGKVACKTAPTRSIRRMTNLTSPSSSERLAAKKALTLEVFEMAYENYCRKAL